ncbi:MAG: hypothetical protein VXZ82_16990 [Planctomycetota bacterium]|nr:hypothetical protein [Planctomycetota bacterium]
MQSSNHLKQICLAP